MRPRGKIHGVSETRSSYSTLDISILVKDKIQLFKLFYIGAFAAWSPVFLKWYIDQSKSLLGMFYSGVKTVDQPL